MELKESAIKRAKDVKEIEIVRAVLKDALMGIVAHQQLTAAEMYELRLSAKKAGVYIKILRNTLAYRALEGTAFACLQPVLKGPILLAFSINEPGSAARLLRDFTKKHEKLVVKHLAFDGQLLESKELGNMADLPTREEAIARLLAALQSPLQKLLYVLSEPVTQFARTLTALKDR